MGFRWLYTWKLVSTLFHSREFVFRLRKNLQQLFIVHPTLRLKVLVHLCRPFIRLVTRLCSNEIFIFSGKNGSVQFLNVCYVYGKYVLCAKTLEAFGFVLQNRHSWNFSNLFVLFIPLKSWGPVILFGVRGLFFFVQFDVFGQKRKHLQRTDGHVWLVFDFSSKFWRKLRFVESLKVLAESIKLDNVHIPPSATLWVWHVQFWFLQRKFFLLVLIFMIYCKKDEACSRIWTCDNSTEPEGKSSGNISAKFATTKVMDRRRFLWRFVQPRSKVWWHTIPVQNSMIAGLPGSSLFQSLLIFDGHLASFPLSLSSPLTCCPARSGSTKPFFTGWSVATYFSS